jgi:hypothetical protein
MSLSEDIESLNRLAELKKDLRNSIILLCAGFFLAIVGIMFANTFGSIFASIITPIGIFLMIFPVINKLFE